MAGAAERFAKGLRTSIEENSTAYGYSVMITVSFGALTSAGARPTAARLFLMVTGAAVGFTVMEAVSTRMFRRTDRESDYIALLGSVMNFVSIGGGLGIALITANLVSGWPAWFLTSLLGTVVYLTMVGMEISIAKRIKR